MREVYDGRFFRKPLSKPLRNSVSCSEINGDRGRGAGRGGRREARRVERERVSSTPLSDRLFALDGLPLLTPLVQLILKYAPQQILHHVLLQRLPLLCAQPPQHAFHAAQHPPLASRMQILPAGFTDVDVGFLEHPADERITAEGVNVSSPLRSDPSRLT